MIEVSSEALDRLRDMLAAQADSGSAVRIAVMGGAGTGLGLLVDDPGPADILVQQEDVPLVIDRQLLGYCQTVGIELVRAASPGTCGGGFLITPGRRINFQPENGQR